MSQYHRTNIRMSIAAVCILKVANTIESDLPVRSKVKNEGHVTKIELELMEAPDDTILVGPIPSELNITSEINSTYPDGIKWCWSGETSNNGPNGLESYNETDACCQTHDNCPDIIDPTGFEHNLWNPTYYTRLSCACDDKFYQCLKNSKDAAADRVGYLYFTVLGTQCFREDYPASCKTQTSIGRCLEYEFDKSKPKEYQWFDVQQF